MAGQVANFLGSFVANTIGVANFAVASYVTSCVTTNTSSKLTAIGTTGFVLTTLQFVENYVYDHYLKQQVVYLLGDAEGHEPSCAQ